LTLYRCMQESLTNAVRHAKASNVEVVVGEMRDQAAMVNGNAAPQVRLYVRDDGIGFEPATPVGHGLSGMQAPVHPRAGTYRAETAAGRGTCVRIAIPLPPDPAAAPQEPQPA